MTTLTTTRLVLRPWRDRDLTPFAALNADATVMQFMPNRLSRAESDALAGRIRDEFAARGWGLWAVEIPGIAPFIGYTGLSEPNFKAHFTPCVEVGWRLAQPYWGYGYATEAAHAALAHAFETLAQKEVVAFTVAANTRSRAVMARLGMSYHPADDFDHPALPAGHPLRRHMLYRRAR